MKSTNLIVFGRDKIEDALKAADAHIDNKINADGSVTVFIANRDNEPHFCHNCERLITPDDIGNIAPGSRLFFCKRAPCFSKYLVEKKM